MNDPVTIYVDGSSGPKGLKKMGIGVYSDAGISISRVLRRNGTSNEAECLAAIMGLREAKRRGLRNISIKSDSLLVVDWVCGNCQCKSKTAKKYVPTIRQLLDDVEGEISWCPGKSNPADPLSRKLVYPA